MNYAFLKTEKILLFIILLFAVFFSFWCFKTNPASWFDEGIYLQMVENIESSGVWGVQTAPGVFTDYALISVGYPVFLPAVAAFKIFGASITVLRLVAILFLLGFVAVFYFLSRKLYGSRLALFSTLLLATFSPLYGNGKNFLGEVPGLFFFAAGLLFLAFSEKVALRNYPLIILSGLFLGMAAAAKPIFLLILPALGIAFLLSWRKFLLTKEGLTFMAALGLGVFLALALWAFTQFGGETPLARVWAHYSNPYYVADYTPVILSNLKRFFTESTPFHLLILFLVSVWFFAKKFRKGGEVAVSEITAWTFASLVLLAYFRTAGWYKNFFPGHVMFFLFLAPGIESFLESFSLKKIFGAAVFLAFAIQLVPLWQENLWCREDAPTALEPYLKSIPADKSVFFLTVPQIAARFDGKNFFQYLKMSDHLKMGEENLERMQRGEFDLVFVPQSVPEEISKIPACYELQENIKKVLIYKRTIFCDVR
ncbi:MAG: glycosyltransferase family 39 protein [bacterium]|nr:glycosyltransferase family 39 protein [bacterium]